MYTKGSGYKYMAIWLICMSRVKYTVYESIAMDNDRVTVMVMVIIMIYWS